MVRRIVLAAVLAAVVARRRPASLVLRGGDGRRRRAARRACASRRRSRRTPAQRPATGRRWPLGARLVRRVQLRERPGGRVVRALHPRTGYGSDRVLAVVARRPGWLGVLSQYMPNSRAGWIPADAAQLRYQPYTLRRRPLGPAARRAPRRDASCARVRVAIGRPGHETPTGRFAITDTLRVSSAGGPYGCCALALTGRQPNVPQGWTGGDRIAIHGTNKRGLARHAGELGLPARQRRRHALDDEAHPGRRAGAHPGVAASEASAWVGPLQLAHVGAQRLERRAQHVGPALGLAAQPSDDGARRVGLRPEEHRRARAGDRRADRAELAGALEQRHRLRKEVRAVGLVQAVLAGRGR